MLELVGEIEAVLFVSESSVELLGVLLVVILVLFVLIPAFPLVFPLIPEGTCGISGCGISPGYSGNAVS